MKSGWLWEHLVPSFRAFSTIILKMLYNFALCACFPTLCCSWRPRQAWVYLLLATRSVGVPFKSIGNFNSLSFLSERVMVLTIATQIHFANSSWMAAAAGSGARGIFYGQGCRHRSTRRDLMWIKTHMERISTRLRQLCFFSWRTAAWAKCTGVLPLVCCVFSS